ncbi:hypothetical protein [Conexibacter woesei]|uniref:hypothetical protein n=1 Tax=Conexibacter woesei TaxID=191495 RepID=UPI00047BA9DA|nr:hypothetical protein [Conexibacter woesei]
MTHTFSIFDTGNLIATFTDAPTALTTLNRLAADSPETSERLLLVAFDASGNPIDDCLPGGHLAFLPPAP